MNRKLYAVGWALVIVCMAFPLVQLFFVDWRAFGPLSLILKGFSLGVAAMGFAVMWRVRP